MLLLVSNFHNRTLNIKRGYLRLAQDIAYRMEGSYYEACNCDAVCPCRRQDDRVGGRSTYGVCDFILSWHITKGEASGTDLTGVNVSMVGTYNDDEDGQPWSVHIYIDERVTDQQFAALSEIFRGNANGNILFTANIAKVLSIKRARIELDHRKGAETIKIGTIASVAVVRSAGFDGKVSCGIPGHDHPGEESVSSLSLHDAPFDWNYVERCGFATDFAYWN